MCGLLPVSGGGCAYHDEEEIRECACVDKACVLVVEGSICVRKRDFNQVVMPLQREAVSGCRSKTDCPRAPSFDSLVPTTSSM